MKLRAFVLSLGIAAAWPMATSAQSEWFWQNPYPQGNDLRAVAILDPMTIVALGDLGALVRTTDGGDTWQAVTLHPTSFLCRSPSWIPKPVGHLATGAPVPCVM